MNSQDNVSPPKLLLLEKGNLNDVQNNDFKITIINIFKKFKGDMNTFWNEDYESIAKKVNEKMSIQDEKIGFSEEIESMKKKNLKTQNGNFRKSKIRSERSLTNEHWVLKTRRRTGSLNE